MRGVLLVVALGLAATLAACSDSTSPPEPIGGAIYFHGDFYLPDSSAVEVGSAPIGTELSVLSVLFRTPEGGLARFAVQGSSDDPMDLLAIGEHPAQGSSVDNIYCNLTDDRVGFPWLNGGQISIVWQSVAVEGSRFSGQGYIWLKQQINYVCADSIQSAYGTFYPGDPVYDQYYSRNCAPEFYLPSQKIGFTCENGMIWP